MIKFIAPKKMPLKPANSYLHYFLFIVFKKIFTAENKSFFLIDGQLILSVASGQML